MEGPFSKEQEEVDEMRSLRMQSRKAREKRARQEEGDGRDEPEREKDEVRTQAEKENMWNRRADRVAINREN